MLSGEQRINQILFSDRLARLLDRQQLRKQRAGGCANSSDLRLVERKPLLRRGDSFDQEVSRKESAFDQDLPRFGVSKPETTLFPRELILRQPAARIENRNFVWEALAPFPKHEILIRRRRPGRKTRNKNSSFSGIAQTLRDPP